MTTESKLISVYLTYPHRVFPGGQWLEFLKGCGGSFQRRSAHYQCSISGKGFVIWITSFRWEPATAAWHCTAELSRQAPALARQTLREFVVGATTHFAGLTATGPIPPPG